MGSGAKNKELKKERWFDAGAAAYERVYPGARARNFPEIENPYICPLCMKPFPRTAIKDKLLTFEDAPPKSYGGHWIALTCQPCNNSFGSSLDASLSTYDSAVYSPCKISIDGVEVNAGQEILSNGRNFQVPDNQNNPAFKDRFFEIVDTKPPEEWVNSGLTIKHNVTARRLADLAWLKSAYMVAFAIWGYRYTLSPALDIIRNQLLNHDNEIIPYFKILNRDLSRSTRFVIYVKEPREFQCDAVGMGHHIIFLPAYGEDLLLYSRLEPFLDGVQKIRIAGDTYLWPKEPLHSLDVRNFDSLLVLPTPADVHLLT